MFGNLLEDNIYIINIKYCDLNYLNYVHHLSNLFYFHMLSRLLGLVTFLGFRGMYVMLCHTFSIEVHERKIGKI
jgi:hypothetical protein